MAMKRLTHEYNQYLKEPNPYYSINIDFKNMFVWNVLLFGPTDTIYEGGIFKCKIKFSNNYPIKSPELYLLDIIHPNVFNNGKVCMSILHDGQDEYNYESISERWNPSHSINSILMSLLLILTEPNLLSPANVDALGLWKNNFDEYKKQIYEYISKN